MLEHETEPTEWVGASNQTDKKTKDLCRPYQTENVRGEEKSFKSSRQDAPSGFWQKALDEESSKLIT